MENNNQNNSSGDSKEKSYEKLLEENRRRIISGENKSVGAKLNPENELKQGEKEELISPVESIAGGEAADNNNIAEKENTSDVSKRGKLRIETTLPPKELLDRREDEFNKSGIRNNEIKSEGMKKRIASFQNKRSQKPIILGLALGLFIIVILAGLYFFGDRIFKKEDPQQIIKSSLETMNDVKTYGFEGNFNLDFTNSGHATTRGQTSKESFSLAMKFDGQADESDADNIKSSFNIKPKVTISQKGGSEDISLDFSTRSFGKVGEETAYFKLNDFDLGVAGMKYGKEIIPYKNRWYFLDMKELREMSKASKEEDFNPEEMIEKIKELSKKYEMIKFQKDLGDTEINGQKVYHYQVGLDSETILDFYTELLEITAPIIAGDKLAIDDVEKFKAELEENKEEILAVIDEILANVETEVWIGKKSKFLHKINIKGNYSERDINEIASAVVGKARARALDAKIKSDANGVRTDLEIYHDNNKGSYKGFELPFHYELVKENIIADDDSYVVWSELKTTTDKWCVDSAGRFGYILGDIKGTQCPDEISKEPKGREKDYKDYINEDILDIKTRVKFDMNLLLSSFNQPVEITEPKETEDLMKVLEEAIQKIVPPPIYDNSEIKNDSDGDGLSDVLEDVYKTDKNNPDTDGDGYLDGNEVENGYDPLVPGSAKLDYGKMFEEKK